MLRHECFLLDQALLEEEEEEEEEEEGRAGMCTLPRKKLWGAAASRPPCGGTCDPRRSRDWPGRYMYEY